MAQEIVLETGGGLRADGSMERSLQAMAAALQDLGDAGAQARKVLDDLRKSLRSAAAQGARAARSLAKFDEIQRLAAPETAKTGGSKGGGPTGKA